MWLKVLEEIVEMNKISSKNYEDALLDYFKWGGLPQRFTLTASILEMNSNSILKEKMNKKAKLIIVILAVLLIVSIILNVSMLIGKGSSNSECNKVDSELMNNQESIQAKDSVVIK